MSYSLCFGIRMGSTSASDQHVSNRFGPRVVGAIRHDERSHDFDMKNEYCML